MKDKLKAVGTGAMFIVFIAACIAIPAVFLLGAAWAAGHLNTLFVVGGLLFGVVLLVLLPLSLFKSLRGFTGTCIFFSSYVFGLITWLYSFVLTYVLWGLWAVIAGVLMLGGAVLPFALLATLFKGMWDPFFSVLILFLLTVGCRLLGAYIAERGPGSY